VASEWSYRPIQAVEAAFRLDVGRSSNADTTESDFNAQTVRSVYAIEGRGQLRAELTREEVVLRRAAEVVPFELTGGRVSGKTWLWRLGLEYRLTQFIQAFVSYDGRSEGGGSPLHTARAEVRAFF
jgi:outer membrane receptor protein involved in Fe transport